MTAAIVAVPLVTAALLLGGRRAPSLAALVACLGALATVVVTLVAKGESTRPTAADPFGAGSAHGLRLSFGGTDLPLVVHLTPTTWLLALVVGVVVLAVQVFSVWYLAEDDRRVSFHATISLFAAAMLLLVLSADLVLTVIGWEVMGWCSYLLIGHWSRKETARRAALKAFLVTRVADIGLVLGLTLLVAGARTSHRGDVIAAWTGPNADGTLLVVAMVLVVVGVLGKAAQLPFQDWLPDAMEGPTPASALIHAATMVAAGTVLLAQLMPLLVVADAARVVLGVSVALTMVVGALIALAQRDLKRLLAWSTVSQVAIMLAPLAAATAQEAPGAALLHLYGHAIFKALLFLTVAWLAVHGGGTLATSLRGTARLHPLALVAWVAGLAALAGVPFLVGGVSKEHVVAAVGHGASSAPGGVGRLLQVALLVTVVLTAAYATRALLVAWTPRPAGPGLPVRARAVMPPAIGVVLGALAGLSVLGGLVLVTDLLPVHGETSVVLLLAVTGLVLVGGALGAWLTRRHDLADPVPGEAGGSTPVPPPLGTPGRALALVESGLGADRAYQALVARPVLGLARVVAFLDDAVIDTYVRSVAWSVLGLGGAGHRSHRRERPATMLLLVAGGALALLAISGWVVLR